MTGPATRWWWLRHAPVPDPEGRIVGRLDLPADTTDEDWFQALARRLPGNPVVVESGALRTRQTLAALEAAGLALAPAITRADLAEQDFGRWEGLTWNQIVTAKDPDLEGFWQDPANNRAPGGESFADVVARVTEAIRSLSEAHAGRDILAVAHAGTIRAALAVALDLPAEKALAFDILPLSLSRFEAVTDGVWRILEVNWLPE